MNNEQALYQWVAEVVEIDIRVNDKDATRGLVKATVSVDAINRVQALAQINQWAKDVGLIMYWIGDIRVET